MTAPTASYTKRCGRCGENLALSAFHKNSSRPDGLQSRCKACVKAHQQQPKIKARRAETGRAYFARNATRLRGINREWHRKNPEQSKESREKWDRLNPDRRREIYRDYCRAYPEKRRSLVNARRAKLLGVSTAPFTDDQLALRWEYYGNKCWVCREEATATDHVKPLSKGGAHMLCNLRPICKPCNSRKSAKWPLPELIPRLRARSHFSLAR